MVLLLSNISFDDFKRIEDKKSYVMNCDYFSMIQGTKKAILDTLSRWVLLYSNFNCKELYITVLSDNYWYKLCGNLTSTKFTTWKTVPRYGLDTDNFKVLETPKITETDILNICNTIKNYNLKKI